MPPQGPPQPSELWGKDKTFHNMPLSPLDAISYAKSRFSKITRDRDKRQWSFDYCVGPNWVTTEPFPSYPAALRAKQRMIVEIASAACIMEERGFWRYREHLPVWMVPILRARIRRKEKTPRKKWTWSQEARERATRRPPPQARMSPEEVRRLLLLLIAAL